MADKLIHLYLMPGMAAKPTIFENIKLPQDKFKIHWLDWMMPEIGESLEDYAKRMILRINHDNVVLLGVSFGGVLVQEMAKHIKLKKLIVVSSIKSLHELPKRMKLMKVTKAYKILPTQLVGNLDLLAKYSFGDNIIKRLELYKKYLCISDKQYLDWAIQELIEWDQEAPNSDAIYIHGDNDAIFPHSCVGNCFIIEGGTHIMILNKYKWFNKNLPKLILDEAVE